ncbi:MAG: GIY-YIG nuclease family protein, partial [Flavobacterium sp.]
NITRSTLYIGVTNNLERRLFEHSTNKDSNSFTAKYNIKYLLYFEKFTWIQDAIAREKELKKWRREKKMALIQSYNPKLKFLNDSKHLFGGFC